MSRLVRSYGEIICFIGSLLILLSLTIFRWVGYEQFTNGYLVGEDFNILNSLFFLDAFKNGFVMFYTFSSGFTLLVFSAYFMYGRRERKFKFVPILILAVLPIPFLTGFSHNVTFRFSYGFIIALVGSCMIFISSLSSKQIIDEKYLTKLRVYTLAIIGILSILGVISSFFTSYMMGKSFFSAKNDFHLILIGIVTLISSVMSRKNYLTSSNVKK
ncbi:MAG: hypothetical protein J7K13_01035 [Thermoplasmata archaeon]|nr:hypothetical protein [Thermoplasmata archaeon]